jgi:PAS domain S-box-containing protein
LKKDCSIVLELRSEEKQGKLSPKNIHKEVYNNTSLNDSSFKTHDNEKQIKIVKKLADTLHEPIFIQNGNYNINWINNELKKTIDITEDQNQKEMCYSLIFNKSSPCSFCPMNTAITNKKSHTTIAPSESNDTWKITSIPLFSNDELIGVVQQIRSSSQIIESVDQRQNSIQHQQTIIENAALGIIVLDEHFNHLTINPTFCGMTGFEHTDIKKNETPLYWPSNCTSEIRTELQRLKQKDHLKMETYFQRKNGSMFPVSIVGSTFIDEGSNEKHMILIIDDITKTKTTERELKVSQLILLSLIQNLEKKVKERTEKIEQLLKQKDEFINQLGHDLKNPLGPLINLLPILLKHETDPHKKEMLTVVQRNTDYMKNLITKTIEFAQLNSGNIRLQLEQIDLHQVCVESIARNDQLIRENNIKIENLLSPNLIVKADKLRIEELFDNIISNAIKYSSDGGTITIHGSSDQTSITISIKDKGIGMDEQQLTHVFDEFYKADPARHDFKSSGLGTSICKRIVEKHNGSLKIESEGLGKGSTVTFTLQKFPVSQQEANIDQPKVKTEKVMDK